MARLKHVFAFFILLFFILTTAALSSYAAPAASGSKLPKAGDFVELGGSDEDTANTEESTSKKSSKSGSDSATASANENEKVLTGTVRVLRKIQFTEVFFKDINDSYVIPSGNSYYGIYKAMTESQKKGTPVSFKANTKSRRILSMEDAPAVEKGSASLESTGAAAAGSSSSTKSGQK